MRVEKENPIENEIWLPVPFQEYADYYHISDQGRLKSLPRANVKNDRIYKPTIAQGSYVVCICIGCKKKTIRVSKLVALAHVPNPKKLRSVAHENGDRLDNRKENLKWVVRSGNKERTCKSEQQLNEEVETMENILQDIANVFNVELDLIKEGYKAGMCTIVRKMFYYVCHTKFDYPLKAMAAVAGKICHSGPSHSIKLVKDLLDRKDAEFMVLWGYYLDHSKIYTKKDFQ